MNDMGLKIKELIGEELYQEMRPVLKFSQAFADAYEHPDGFPAVTLRLCPEIHDILKDNEKLVARYLLAHLVTFAMAARYYEQHRKQGPPIFADSLKPFPIPGGLHHE